MSRHDPGPPVASKLGRFPFDPARLPFFYGWAVLGSATLGVLMSAPGQTVGVSVFTDFLIDALGLSRSLLSLAYCAGTIASALLLSRLGRLYDRYGGRWVAVGAAASLALVLAGLSVSPAAARGLAALLPERFANAAAFVVIAVGFFLLRFCGPGAPLGSRRAGALHPGGVSLAGAGSTLRARGRCDRLIARSVP